MSLWHLRLLIWSLPRCGRFLVHVCWLIVVLRPLSEVTLGRLFRWDFFLIAIVGFRLELTLEVTLELGALDGVRIVAKGLFDVGGRLHDHGRGESGVRWVLGNLPALSGVELDDVLHD